MPIIIGGGQVPEPHWPSILVGEMPAGGVSKMPRCEGQALVWVMEVGLNHSHMARFYQSRILSSAARIRARGAYRCG